MLNLSEIKMIFFDAGNVFVSDDPSGCFAYEQLYERINKNGQLMTIEEFFRLRTQHAKKGGGLWSFVAQYVPEAEFKAWQKSVRDAMYCQWAKLSPEIKSMQDVPRQLAEHYRLGIIANQPQEMETVLLERGLARYFDVMAISEKLKLYKPDPAFYQWAVDASGLAPHETLMVGDRIDNDIIPAKSIGMRTAWLRLGYDRREWAPETEFQQVYAESIRQASYSEAEPVDDASTPDLIFTSAEELLEGLLPEHSSAR